ncbi:MAG TPA: rRNA adenine N-6-methyltransferase family protein [Anaerolineales bacterium]
MKSNQRQHGKRIESSFTPNRPDETDWEARWAPYDPPTYQAVLDLIQPADVVLEIGAGDFGLARQIARVARQVIAIEIQEALYRQAMATPAAHLPDNLIMVLGDARMVPIPPGITTGVLLMRHCRHFRLYAEKLKAAGYRSLITNARWRMGVEQVLLQAPRLSYREIKMGWYACWCGKAGFKPGPAEQYTPELDAVISEVTDCPDC